MYSYHLTDPALETSLTVLAEPLFRHISKILEYTAVESSKVPTTYSLTTVGVFHDGSCEL